jgi:hypothetical protein
VPVHVRACGVCRTDLHLVEGSPAHHDLTVSDTRIPVRNSSVEYGLDLADEALTAIVAGGFLYDFWLILIGSSCSWAPELRRRSLGTPAPQKARQPTRTSESSVEQRGESYS